MHGDADRLVSPQESKAMEEALRKAGNDVTLLMIPGQGHGFLTGTSTIRRYTVFLTEY